MAVRRRVWIEQPAVRARFLAARYDAGPLSQARLWRRNTIRHRRNSRWPVATRGTPRGICSIQFGDSDTALEGALRREYPQAEIVRTDKQLTGWVRAVRDRIRGENTGSLPLDIRATACQRLVWEQRRTCPRCGTRS